jgi:hypothetical protein
VRSAAKKERRQYGQPGSGDVVSEGIDVLSTQLDQSETEVRCLTDELHCVRENAQIDALSGLLNRRGFDRELQRMVPKDGAIGGALALIMLDIDCEHCERRWTVFISNATDASHFPMDENPPIAHHLTQISAPALDHLADIRRPGR